MPTCDVITLIRYAICSLAGLNAELEVAADEVR